MTFLKVSAAIVAIAISASAAEASTITCPNSGSYNRQATMSDVIACAYAGPVTGTPGAADVTTQFGGSWTGEGLLTGNGTNDWLSAEVTSGSWGSLPVAGTWGLNSAFWNTYGRAVITFHLGNGAGDPDWFFFELTPNSLAGIFSIVRVSGSGGGLSNIFLWGSGTPNNLEETCIGGTDNCNPVPEPATLLMFGTGLAAMAATMRRRGLARRKI